MERLLTVNQSKCHHMHRSALSHGSVFGQKFSNSPPLHLEHPLREVARNSQFWEL